MNRFMKPALAIFIVSLFLLGATTTPAPVAAQRTADFHESVVENATFIFKIADLETDSGQHTAPVALGGGPWTANATPVSLGGHFTPVPSKAATSWTDLTTWRNVITLGEDYTIEVTIDTLTPDEEAVNPEAPARVDIATYLPTNPNAAYANVFRHTLHKTRILDAEGKVVTIPHPTETGTDVPTFFDPQLTQPLLLPLFQYGNETFYEVGGPDPSEHWIGVTMFEGLGYWTLSYLGGPVEDSDGNVLLDRKSYQVGFIGTDLETGIAHFLEITNRAMLAWMTDPADPLIMFRLEFVGILEPEEPPETDEDSPGFELGIVLFSLASVATLVAYRKRK